MVTLRPLPLFHLIVDALVSVRDPARELDANEIYKAAEAVIIALIRAQIERPEAGVLIYPPQILAAFQSLPPSRRDRLTRACALALANGSLNRLDLMVLGEIGIAQASNDIATINHFLPGALVYDASAKSYTPGAPLKELGHV